MSDRKKMFAFISIVCIVLVFSGEKARASVAAYVITFGGLALIAFGLLMDSKSATPRYGSPAESLVTYQLGRKRKPGYHRIRGFILLVPLILSAYSLRWLSKTWLLDTTKATDQPLDFMVFQLYGPHALAFCAVSTLLTAIAFGAMVYIEKRK